MSNYLDKLKMGRWNSLDITCKNEWAIFTRWISFTGPLYFTDFWASSGKSKALKGNRWAMMNKKNDFPLFDVKTCSHDPFLRIRFLLVLRIRWCEHIENDLLTHIRRFEKTDRNRTCSVFIWHSSWKLKGADIFCMICLWSFWCQIIDSLSVLKIKSCEHTTNDLPKFSLQKWNLEIGPSERLLPIFGTKNPIPKIGSCERAFSHSWLLFLTLLAAILPCSVKSIYYPSAQSCQFQIMPRLVPALWYYS